MSQDEPAALTPEDERRLLWLAIGVATVLMLVIAVLSYYLWDPDIADPQKRRSAPIIMFVPVPILQWAFAGAMISVLYRLAYRIDIKAVGLELYTWVVAKPLIGLFMGALVYFVALAVAKLLDGPPEALQNALWLNVVAFVGGFSDELSIGLIKRFVQNRLGFKDEQSASARKPE
jgi:hypothetical protein